MKKGILLWIVCLVFSLPCVLQSADLTSEVETTLLQLAQIERHIQSIESRVDKINEEKALNSGTRGVDWDAALSSKEDVLDLIIKVSNEEGINPVFVMAMVKVESNFNHKALSPMGAVGLMQVLPKTAWWFDSSLDVWNPEDNLRLGIRYYKYLRAKFKGYTQLALAAYNAGPHNVIKAGWKIPNIEETQLYVPKVMANYNKFRRIVDA